MPLIHAVPLLVAAAAVLPLAAATIVRAAPAGSPAHAGAITFNEDVAPIVFARCAPCHRPGAAGPFPLLTYDDVKSRAKLIAEVTAARVMPPWPPESGHGEFVGERRLTDAEIATIQQWVRNGAPEGDRSTAPPAPPVPFGWHLGTPDLVVSMAEPYTLPPDGSDVFRTFVIPLPVSGTRYVRGMEFRPGNAHVVHHAIMHVDRSGAARQAEGIDADPDADGMIFTAGETPDGHFLGWSPGELPVMGPEDLAWRVDQGTDLILQLHMLPTGKPEKLQASVGLFFAKTPPARVGFGLQLGSYVIDIPPGEPRYTVEDSYVLPVDVEVHAIYPHAHYLGKDIRAEATLPDGTTRPLIWIKDWDFDWQGAYRYVTPVTLPKGTTIAVRFTYDNSAGNPRNPASPPVRVRYGGQSSDEMANLWLQAVPRAAADLAVLKEDYARTAAMRRIAGYLAMLAESPGRAGIHRGLGFAYLRVGNMERAFAHLTEALRLEPGDAVVHYSLGNLEAGRGDIRRAAAHFRAAISFRPGFAEATNNLGVMLQSEGQLDEALRMYRRAVEIDPAYAEAHNNLGVMLQADGRLDEAIEHFEEAVRLNPEYALARENLAAALRARK